MVAFIAGQWTTGIFAMLGQPDRPRGLAFVLDSTAGISRLSLHCSTELFFGIALF